MSTSQNVNVRQNIGREFSLDSFLQEKPEAKKVLSTLMNDTRFAIAPMLVDMKGNTASEPNSPLLVSTISMSLAFSQFADAKDRFVHFKPVERQHDGYRMFTLANHISINDLKELLLSLLEKVRVQMSDFERKLELPEAEASSMRRMIVCNELSFPFPLEKAEVHDFLLDIEKTLYTESVGRRFWSETSLVLGSFHSHSTMKNSAVVSLPRKPTTKPDLPKGVISKEDFPNEIRGKDGRDECERYNFLHDKFAAAEKIGEKLAPRDEINWYFYDTPMGVMAILICYDSLDPRMIMRLLKYDYNEQKTDKRKAFDLIVIPTFSNNPKVRHAAQSLSQALDTTVVYVNCQYPDEPRKENQIESVTPRNVNWVRKDSHAVFDRGVQVGIAKPGSAGVVLSDHKAFEHKEDLHLWGSSVVTYLSRPGRPQIVTD